MRKKTPVYIGIDDTDNLESTIGTGKMARFLCEHLAREFPAITPVGVVRHQLLIDPRVPYTTHNSPACASLDIEGECGAVESMVRELTVVAAAFIRERAAPGSDPGLCVVMANEVPAEVVSYGLLVTHTVVDKASADECAATHGLHLEELGGTGDGVIGALAAVGLTHHGYGGRYLEYRDALRSFASPVSASDVRALGIEVVSLDKNASFVPDHAQLVHDGWFRPRLIGARPVIVAVNEDGVWYLHDERMRTLHKKAAS